MHQFLLLLIFIILLIYLSKLISNKKKKDTYIKAGKKWEEIIEELSKRK